MSFNSFSISFDRFNQKLIECDQEIKPIFDDFDFEPTKNIVYILTGPKGCGKTVTLGHVLDVYRDKNDWVVSRLSQFDNMLEQMARLLYEVGVSKIEAFEDEFEKQTTSIHAYLNNLFEYFKKKGIHILVAIDDVCKTNGMVDFIRAYQGFLIDHYDVRLLMSGSYNDIVELEKEPSISFLFRASKIQLSPLSI